MKSALKVAVALCLVPLAGCISPQPAEAPPEVLACPEPAPCPVCEVFPEPQQCPEPEVIEKIVEVPAPLPPMAETAGKLHLPIIGSVENVLLEPAGVLLPARIDTGLDTTLVHAGDIQLVEKEGKRYVRFKLQAAGGEPVAQELPLRRRVSVTLADGEAGKAYVVRMWLSLGEMRSRVDVQLSAEPGEEEYPLVVGRNFLLDAAIVDVSRQNTQTTSESPSS